LIISIIHLRSVYPTGGEKLQWSIHDPLFVSIYTVTGYFFAAIFRVYLSNKPMMQ